MFTSLDIYSLEENFKLFIFPWMKCSLAVILEVLRENLENGVNFPNVVFIITDLEMFSRFIYFGPKTNEGPVS